MLTRKLFKLEVELGESKCQYDEILTQKQQLEQQVKDLQQELLEKPGKEI